MTVLQALAGYYDRMATRGEAEPPGFTREKISFAVVLDAEGVAVAVDDLRESSGKRLLPRLIDVPAGQKRTVAVVPNFLWDKTAYVLGVTAGEAKRTLIEHESFCALHARLLATTGDVGLVALRRFLENWTPDRFTEPPFHSDMRDTNIVFRLEGDEAGLRFVHQRPAAAPLIETRSGDGERGLCLVTGETAPIARLHPAIKGVDGAQSMGAALVSFNLDAFASWEKEQGANAPTSEAAAARYGAALNRLLDRGSGTRLRIGDATVVFWADTSGIDEVQAQAAEQLLAAMFGSSRPTSEADHDASEARKVREVLQQIAEGRPVAHDGVKVAPGTAVHILGLSPNAARLSVRFWLTERLETLASNLSRHEAHCRIEPLPWKTPPTINQLLVRTVAAQEKWDNIPPLLAGEVTRTVLGGTAYPRTLLSNALMRLRAGDDPARGWHAAAIRAVLIRLDDEVKQKGEPPVSLDKDEPNPAYRLGRLFAVLEEAQEQALGHVNATIRDRYFGAASATPASVFPLLLRGVQNHLGKLRKDNPAAAGGIEIKLGEVIGGIETALPRSLKLEDQGRFAIGYYHQRSDRFRKRDAAQPKGENHD